MSKQQNRCLNVVKAIACIAVIVLHCEFPTVIGSALNMAARFAVPLFFMVSGYFLFHDDIAVTVQKLPKKCLHILRYVIVYFVINLIVGAISAVIKGESLLAWLSELFNVTAVAYALLFNSTLLGVGGWFLSALLYVYLVLYLVFRFAPVLIRPWLPVLLLGIGFVLSYGLTLLHHPIAPWYYRNFLFDGLPFTLFGYFIHQYHHAIQQRLQSLHPLIYLAVVGAGTLLSGAERYILGGFDVYFGTLLITGSAFLYAVMYPDKFSRCTYLQQIGQSQTLYVYLIHPFVISFISYAAELCHIEQSAGYLWLRPVVVVAVTLAISQLCYCLVQLVAKKRKPNRQYGIK